MSAPPAAKGRADTRFFSFVRDVVAREEPQGIARTCRTAGSILVAYSVQRIDEEIEYERVIEPTAQWAASQKLARVPRTYALPAASLDAEGLELLQKWEGEVERANRRQFVARLLDLTDPNRPEESATFEMDEVSPQDADLVAPGAVFYWVIGYELGQGGQKKKVSFLRFRRLPMWSKKRVETAQKTAKRYERFFGPRNGTQESTAS